MTYLPRTFQIIVTTALLIAAPLAVSAQESWRVEMGETNWTRLVSNGCFLVSSADGLACHNGADGSVKWQRSDFATVTSAGTWDLRTAPYLLIDPAQGKRLRRKDPVPIKEVIDGDTGATLVKLDGLKGTLNGFVPMPELGLALAIETVKAKNRDDSGIFITAFDMPSGTVRWRIRYADRKGQFKAPLLAYPQPVSADGVLYLSYFGVTAIDAADGAQLWNVASNTLSGSMRQTRSAPVIVDGIAYAAFDKEFQALNARDGSKVWGAKLKRGVTIPEVQVTERYVVARLGGLFSDGKKVDDQGSLLGAMAFDRANGGLLWTYGDGKGGLTNLMVDEGRDLVAFADAETIIGVKLSLGSPQFEVPHNYFRIYGQPVKKSSGFAISGGFAKSGPGGTKGGGGGLGGGSCGTEIEDLPFHVEFQRDDILVRGPGAITAFDPESRTIQWSSWFGATKYPLSDIVRLARMPGYSEKGRSYHMVIAVVGKGRRNREILMVMGVDPAVDRVVSRVDLEGKDPLFYIDHKRDRLYRVYRERVKRQDKTTIVGHLM